MTRQGEPGPVLKWAGGKRPLLGDLLPRLPTRIDTYYEPFVGGGAVFFALAMTHRFRRAVLADTNADLIDVYRALQTDVDGVIDALHAFEHSEESYYRVRESVPKGLIERAARVIYLNHTGYNGLYRVNSRGLFNVPFGRYKNPNICDEPRLRAAADILRGVTLLVSDFEAVCADAQRGDAVYLDPPYLPVSRTASFTAYAAGGFSVLDQERLALVFSRLGERGVAAVLSNSDTETTRALFAGWRVTTVQARRAINSNASRRGNVNEILVETEPAVPEKRPAGARRKAK